MCVDVAGSGGVFVWVARCCDGRRLGGDSEVLEDGADRVGLEDVGDDCPSFSTGAIEHIVDVYTSKEGRPVVTIGPL